MNRQRKRIDFDGINAALLGQYPGLLEIWAPGGQVRGKEYVVKNPTRQDSRPGSFTINIDSGIWSDFATGDSGSDPISLYAYLHNLTQGQAAKELRPPEGTPPPAPAPTVQKSEKWKIIMPVPAGVPDKPTHFMDNEIESYFEYRDQTGNLLYYVCRTKPDSSGNKKTPPLSYCENPKDGFKRWKFQAPEAPRPVYGLDKLYTFQNAGVFIVEGEKCAKALQMVFPENPCITTGSTTSAKFADLTPLKDRKIIIWPDNDEPGEKYRTQLIKYLQEQTTEIKFLKIPEDKPKGWDCADAIAEGWDAARIIEFIKSNSQAARIRKNETKPASIGTPPPNFDINPLLNETLYPFRFLGFDNRYFFYLPENSGQKFTIKDTEHDESNLTALADPVFWERNFSYNNKIDWKFVRRILTHEIAYKKGIVYRPQNLRNIGTWFDGGRIVVHMGNKLRVDNKIIDITKIESKYIYERKTEIEEKQYKAINNDECQKLVKIAERFSWVKEISPRLLCGFLVSGLCGDTVKWKPHAWITGHQGCGKSSVLRLFVNRVLGNCVHKVGAGTTEAGLRQLINGTSFPITFDEAEATEESGKVRIDKIIELMRASASPGNELIIKGGSNGTPIYFSVKSSFCLASINTSLELAQDKARTVNLEMGMGKIDKWEQFEAEILDTLTPEFCGGFRERIFQNIPVILKNMNTFIMAVRDKLESQRFGDVYGVLLGGAYALYSLNEITLEQAKEWVDAREWTDQEDIKSEKDETECIKTILEKIVIIETKNRSLAELINICCVDRKDYNGFMTDQHVENISWDECNATLRRFGIMPNEYGIIISNSHSQIKRILKDTPWASNWGKILKRIPGAESTNPKIFIAGQKSQRGTLIAYEALKNIIELPYYENREFNEPDF